MPTPKLRKKSRRVQSRSKPKSKSRSRFKSRRVRPRSQKKPRVKTRSKPRSKRIRGGITKKTAALTLGVGVLGTGVALSRGHRQQTPEDDEYNLYTLISEIQVAFLPSTEKTPLISNIKELESALLSDNLNLFFTECAKNPGVTQLCNNVKTSPLLNNYLSERLKRVFYDENLNYFLSEITKKVNGNTEAQETLNTLLQSVKNKPFVPSDFYQSLYNGLELQLIDYPRFLVALEVPFDDVKVEQFLRDLYELIPESKE